jgi:hypothetical protein
VAAGNSGSVTVRRTAQVNGKQLEAGEYKVQWDGSGSAVQITFHSGQKTVLTTTGAVKKLEKRDDNSYVLYRGADGNLDEIGEIHFAGKKMFLAFEQAGPAK